MAPRQTAEAVVGPAATHRPVFQGWGFQAWPQPQRTTSKYSVESFQFTTYDDCLGEFQRVTGEYYAPRPGSTPPPLLEVSPILGGALTGYSECHYFCAGAARRGYASFFLHQDAVLLDPQFDGVELERRLRSVTRSTIKALDLILGHYDVDAQRLGSLGISFGSMRNVLLTAAEPRLRYNVMCLAGGGLPSIFDHASESMVHRYLDGRRGSTGCTRDEVIKDLQRHLTSDPLSVASTIDPNRVLLIVARFDRVVSLRSAQRLRRALGMPEAWFVPLGHYSSVAVFPWARSVSLDRFDLHLGSAGPNQDDPMQGPPRGHP